jgi:uncharacterized membrane protein YgcG
MASRDKPNQPKHTAITHAKLALASPLRQVEVCIPRTPLCPLWVTMRVCGHIATVAMPRLISMHAKLGQSRERRLFFDVQTAPGSTLPGIIKQENVMRKMFATTASAIVLAMAASASSFAQGTTAQQPGAAGTMKMTQAECESMWNRADSARSGSLSQTQAQSHVTNFSTVDTDSDGKLSRAEFLAGCDKGLVQSSASTGGGTGSGGSSGMSGGTGTGSGSSGAGTSQGTGTSGTDTTKK